MLSMNLIYQLRKNDWSQTKPFILIHGFWASTKFPNVQGFQDKESQHYSWVKTSMRCQLFYSVDPSCIKPKWQDNRIFAFNSQKTQDSYFQGKRTSPWNVDLSKNAWILTYGRNQFHCYLWLDVKFGGKLRTMCKSLPLLRPKNPDEQKNGLASCGV